MSKLPDVNLQKLQNVVLAVESSIDNFQSLESLSVAVASTIWAEENDLSGEDIVKLITKNKIKTKDFVGFTGKKLTNSVDVSDDNSANGVIPVGSKVCVACDANGKSTIVPEDAFSTTYQNVLRQIPKLKRKVIDPNHTYYLCKECLQANPKVKDAHAKKVEEEVKLAENAKLSREKRSTTWENSLAEKCKKAGLTDVQLLATQHAFVEFNAKVDPGKIKQVVKSCWGKLETKMRKEHPFNEEKHKDKETYLQMHKTEMGSVLSELMKK